MARGSVSKRCQCRDEQGRQVKGCRKPHGSWGFVVDAGDDPETGARRQVRRGGFRTRTEAEEAMTAELTAIDQGTWTDDKQITVGQWLDRWLAGHRGQVKTLAGYRSHVDLLWKPKIGKYRLRDLRRHHVEAALAEIDETVAQQRRRDGRRGGRPVEKQSPATRDAYRRTLRAALGEAIRQQLITNNPAEGRMQAIPQRSRPELTIWQPDETARFLDAAVSHPLSALFELAAYGGLRRSELCGARWSDLDEDGGGITIRQTIVEAPRREIPQAERICPSCGQEHTSRVFKVTKSRAGDRWVPLVPTAQAALVAHRLRQDADRAALGPDYSDHDLIFCRTDGTPLRPSDVTHEFQRLTKSLGLPVIRLHDMRHGAASLLLAGGVPVEIVQMILGHSSPEVTRRIYAHVLRDVTAAQVEQAAKLLDPHRRWGQS